MSTILDFLSSILGIVMKGCYSMLGSYGLSLILFTLLTKFILFPVNILIQKNSIKMVKMQPELDALKIKYIDDKDKYVDEQLALYRKNHYHSSIGIIPLVFQLVLVMGLLGVVYNPLTHVSGIAAEQTQALNVWLCEETGVEDAGKSAQLQVIHLIQSGKTVPDNISDDTADIIRDFPMRFCGFDLGLRPSMKYEPISILIPVLAGLSALAMCAVQNKVNVLQITAGKLNKYGTTVFMIGFSAYFACLVPAGVGLYWIFGNLFAIPSMLVLNAVIPPKKYIDIDYLRRIRSQKEQKEAEYRKYHSKERDDYRRFCNTKGKRLVFYSESNGFYKFYAGMIDYICQHSDLEIHYVTSDPKDNIFSDARKQIHAYYAAHDKYLIPLFMKLDCGICVMTMPDLEKYHIKRSRIRDDIEYIYVSHGMGSNNLAMRKGSLNWYDTIYCVGPHAVSEIRETEELYGLKQKRIVEAGYPLLDDMLAEYNSSEHKRNDPPVVMIAPSWQPDNIIDLCAEQLLDGFTGSDYRVILRPHPQQVKNQPELFEAIQEKYAGCPNIEIQTDFSVTSPVMEADLLITDWSGICWEYAFSTKRPVLFINTPMKVMNNEYDRIKTVPMNIALRNVIGKSLDLTDLDHAVSTAEELMSRSEEYRSIISDTLDKTIFNIGKSKIISGKYIIKSLGAEFMK